MPPSVTTRAERGAALRNPIDPSRSIRALLFDLDGTLYRQTPVRLCMALELVTLPLASPSKTLSHLAALRAYRHAQESLRGEGVAPALATRQIAMAAEASGLSDAAVGRLVDEWMIARPLKYLRRWRASGLDLLMSRVTTAGLPAAVLSDYPARAKLDALGLAGRFTHVLCTTDAGIDAFKPHPRGFLRACELLDVEPADVLMVGDRIEVDAVGAAAAGMPSVIVGLPERRTDSYMTVPSLGRLAEVLGNG